jgi:hypothetical protein
VYSSINAGEQGARRMVPDKTRSMSKYSHYVLWVLELSEINLQKTGITTDFRERPKSCALKSGRHCMEDDYSF